MKNTTTTTECHIATITPDKIWEFLATKYFRSMFRVSIDIAFQIMQVIADNKQFELMKQERYQEILVAIRGFTLIGRCVQDEEHTWMKQGDLLRHLNPMERIIFQNSVTTLFNKKNGVLTYDDEMIGSRANDVESKSLSNRKSAKEGPVADCVSCALTSVLFGMRLRVKGETEAKNMNELLGTLPLKKENASTNNSCLTMDRGYGKIKNIAVADSFGYDVYSFAATRGSNHSIIALSELEAHKKQWEKKVAKKELKLVDLNRRLDLLEEYTFDDSTKLLGSEVLTATSDSILENQKVYAISVCEVFDNKKEVKHLPFFITGDHDDLMNCWVARTKHMSLSNDHLFSHKKASKERIEIENKLLQNCYALSMSQRTLCWFMGRPFRLTGTIVDTLKCKYEKLQRRKVTHKFLKESLEKCLDSWFSKH